MILKNLFSEGRIGGLVLRNRVVFPPMGTFLADEGGFVSKRLIDYHVARARGGTGMNIVEIAAVHPTTKGAKNLGIYDDRFLPGLSELAAAIKAAGGRACIQLWHAGRQTNSSATGMPIVAPSPIPCPLCREMPKELTKQEIRELVEAYGDAALRAKRAGFDAVELHGAHGYLIAQFVSPYSNKRTDEYGGSFENRARFALEVIQNVRQKVGPDYPVIYRLSAEERVKDGMTIGDTMKLAALLEKTGVDAIHVSIGVYETLQYTVPPLDLPIAFNVDNAAKVKSVVGIPVIAVDRINDPIVAERVLEEEKADFVAMGRAQLADPNFCNKALRGEFDTIVKCIGCNQGCVDRLFVLGFPVSCLRNPACGREAEYELKPAKARKKILVVGGGPAGLEAAITLKRRGHDVMLCEKSSTLGGQMLLAGIPPRKGEFAQAAIQMGQIACKEGVEVRLQTEVTPTVVEELNPDVVVIATGAEPAVPSIPGVMNPHVVSAHDVLRGTKTVGQNVVVIGGGLVGVETAEFLADQGKQVTIVEMLEEIARDVGFLRKPFVFESIARKGIAVLTEATCKEIRDGVVVVEKGGKLEEIRDVDSVVIAVGATPVDHLAEALLHSGRECHVIGDAKEPRKVLDAIWEAAELARQI